MIHRRALLSFAILVGMTVPASAQVTLEYKFPVGTRDRVTVTTKTNQTLTIAGMDIETKAHSTIVMAHSVGQRKPDGMLPVSQKIESIKTEIELPGGNQLKIDSSDPDAKIENPDLAFLGDVYKALIGATHTFLLDDHGKVKFVEGTEKVLAKLDSLDPKVAALVKGQLQPETVQRSFEQSHANLPDMPIRQGETWERTEMSEIGGGQLLTFKRRYEYLGTVEQDGRTLDKIGVRATAVTYTMDPTAESPAKVEKSDLKIESSDGMILFDRAAGETLKSTDKTHIKGDMTLKVGEMVLPTKLDLTLESTSTLEPRAKSN